MTPDQLEALQRYTRLRKEGAIISDCQTYRFALWRQWEGGAGFALWIMFNPSTADQTEDDATIRRCVNFSKGWGLHALAVVNLHPLRSTDPKAVAKHDEPAHIVLENRKWIAALAPQADSIICAWGACARRSPRPKTVTDLVRSLDRTPQCLGTTRDGWPKHPVRLANDTPLQAYDS